MYHVHERYRSVSAIRRSVQGDGRTYDWQPRARLARSQDDLESGARPSGR